jgi:hypothetical protein
LTTVAHEPTNDAAAHTTAKRKVRKAKNRQRLVMNMGFSEYEWLRRFYAHGGWAVPHHDQQKGQPKLPYRCAKIGAIYFAAAFAADAPAVRA